MTSAADALMPQPGSSRDGAVAGPSPLTAQAGLRALAAGGHAEGKPGTPTAPRHSSRPDQRLREPSATPAATSHACSRQRA